MPDDRLQRARGTLPEGYQAPSPVHFHAPAAFDAARLEHICKCGARLGAAAGDSPDWFIHRHTQSVDDID